MHRKCIIFAFLHGLFVLFFFVFVCYRRNDVQFTYEPAKAPIEIKMDPSMIKEYAKQFEAAKNAPIPDDDDDI